MGGAWPNPSLSPGTEYRSDWQSLEGRGVGRQGPTQGRSLWKGRGLSAVPVPVPVPKRSGAAQTMAGAARRGPVPGGEKRILCVGLVCLDIISVVEAYPAEDSDIRYRRAGCETGQLHWELPRSLSGLSRCPRSTALQVRVAAMAAGWECLQLLHGAGAAGSPLRLHGLADHWARC